MQFSVIVTLCAFAIAYVFMVMQIKLFVVAIHFALQLEECCQSKTVEFLRGSSFYSHFFSHYVMPTLLKETQNGDSALSIPGSTC